MTMANAFDPAAGGGLSSADRALVERRARLLGPAYRLFYETPVHVVRGEGVWLFDPAGNAYLDVYNNVASVGHCHPQVVAAIARQAATLNTHTRYLHETILDYAERLLARMPAELGHVMFTCTGSEANDLALRLARAATGGEGIVITRFAYHGVTRSDAELSPALGPDGPKNPATRLIPAPDPFRRPGDIAAAMAADVRAAIADLKAHGIRPAALLVDTIFSSDGVFPDPAGFLAEAVAAIRAEGGLFIADEVQPGFGRIGPAFWGFARHGLVPDLVTTGKPMGNGHPVAAVFVRPEIVAEFGRKLRYFNTFGGNPVSCAAGLAVLDVIEGEGLAENAAAIGAHLLAGLRELAGRFPVIADVRGAGLFLGVELVTDPETRTPDPALAARVVNGLRARRVLISATGPEANILKLRPPLVFSRANADLFLDRLAATLVEVA